MSLNIREYDLRRAGREEGEAIGFDKGRKDGLTEGLHQGAYQNKLETAAVMKNRGYDADEICSITGITKDILQTL